MLNHFSYKPINETLRNYLKNLYAKKYNMLSDYDSNTIVLYNKIGYPKDWDGKYIGINLLVCTISFLAGYNFCWFKHKR